jgi:hypothetical protein
VKYTWGGKQSHHHIKSLYVLYHWYIGIHWTHHKAAFSISRYGILIELLYCGFQFGKNYKWIKLKDLHKQGLEHSGIRQLIKEVYHARNDT